MTVEEKKERNRKYGAICARAKAMGIMQGDAIGAIMDIDSADQRFNLRLDECPICVCLFNMLFRIRSV